MKALLQPSISAQPDLWSCTLDLDAAPCSTPRHAHVFAPQRALLKPSKKHHSLRVIHHTALNAPLRTGLSSTTSSCIRLAVWIISVISANRLCFSVMSLQNTTAMTQLLAMRGHAGQYKLCNHLANQCKHCNNTSSRQPGQQASAP